MDALERLTENMLPFAEHIGVEFVSADKEKVVARMKVQPELCTRPEILHGGAIMAFADTIGAAGAFLNLPEGAGTATLESKTNFIAPAALESTVMAEATPVHIGRRTMIWQTRVTSEEGRLIALVTQTQMVLQG